MSYMIRKSTAIGKPSVLLTNGLSEILEIEDRIVADRLASKLNEVSPGVRHEVIPAGLPFELCQT